MINGLMLILLNIAYFYCNFFPKHLLEFKSPLSIIAVLLNLIFYLIFALFLIIVFSKNKNPFSDNIFSPIKTFWQNIEIKKIIIIIASKIIFDILKHLASGLLNKNALYFIDFSTLALWIIFYNVCATKNSNIFIKKPLVNVIIILLVFSLTTYFDFAIIKDYNHIIQKYDVISEFLAINIKNLDFVFQFKNFLLDTLLGIILIVMHSLFNKTEIVKDRLSKVKCIIQTFTLIVSFFILVALKMWIFPYSCIHQSRNLTAQNSPKIETNKFYANTEISLITRVGYNRSSEIVFCKTKDEIFYNGYLVLTYISNDNQNANSYSIEGNQMTITDQFEKVNYNNIDFSIYKNRVLCFLDNGKPTAVPCDSNEKIPYNQNLLTIYKYLIESGQWRFFEQGSEYLIEHDEEFIKPYLERYLSNEFTRQELEMLEKFSINDDYIQKLSEKLAS